jgi:uncharacterized damage-inducible protein DinB
MPPTAPTSIGQSYLAECRRRLVACHAKIHHCLVQLSDEQIWWRPHEVMNSIGNIVLHLCGNVRQWVVAGAQGLPDTRDRPTEFAERKPIAKAELLERLGAVVREADETLARIADNHLLQARRIQGFDETVLSAIFDSLAHFNGHTQEIIYVTRLQLGGKYRLAWEPASAEQGAPKR